MKISNVLKVRGKQIVYQKSVIAQKIISYSNTITLKMFNPIFHGYAKNDFSKFFFQKIE